MNDKLFAIDGTQNLSKKELLEIEGGSLEEFLWGVAIGALAAGLYALGDWLFG
ncbi:MAG: hypothetical protein IPH62_19200 [Ignavibacteriae bacterium]|nr:hypothetical protein [Ignavibacteriota bacterium]